MFLTITNLPLFEHNKNCETVSHLALLLSQIQLFGHNHDICFHSHYICSPNASKTFHKRQVSLAFHISDLMLYITEDNVSFLFLPLVFWSVFLFTITILDCVIKLKPDILLLTFLQTLGENYRMGTHFIQVSSLNLPVGLPAVSIEMSWW